MIVGLEIKIGKWDTTETKFSIVSSSSDTYMYTDKFLCWRYSCNGEVGTFDFGINL